jgi:hypothetical protein
MFPDPLTRSEIAAVLRPLLARCDAAGRRYVVELASADPAREMPNETGADARAALLELFREAML